MKVVEARSQNTINLMAAQPIRHGDSSKEAPAEQRESIATTFWDQEVLLVPGALLHLYKYIYTYKLDASWVKRETGSTLYR